MTYQYTINLDYIGTKDLEFADLEIGLDNILTIDFEAEEDLSEAEITEVFEDGGIFKEVALTIEQVVGMSVDESEVEISEIEVNEG